MKSNYNDIIDIILTLIEDPLVQSSMVVSGSIVPYIVIGKESYEYHSDFYILLKEKKMNYVRKKVKNLSKEYMFDVISDSKKICNYDYGFKMHYENTMIGFFPYSIIDNNFTIKSYSVNKNSKEISLKTKTIPEISKSSIIRSVRFSNDKNLRIMSPEYILIDKEVKEKEPGNPTKETMQLLSNIADEEVLNVLRRSINKTKIKVKTEKIKKNNILFITSLIIIFIILLIIAYVCFRK